MEQIDSLMFIEEIKSNNYPLKFLCEDDHSYFIKIRSSSTGYIDIIYETVAFQLAKYLELPIPEANFIKLVKGSYSSNHINFNKSEIFEGTIGFGSKEVKNHNIITKYNFIINNKGDYNRIQNPLDFILIGIFDFHLANLDRYEDNFNLIFYPVEKGKKDKIVAIDNVAIFNNPSQANRFKPSSSNVLSKNILKSNLGKKLLNYYFQDANITFEEVSDIYFSKIDAFPEIVNKTFETFPEEWRCMDGLKERIIEFLINKERIVNLTEELTKYFYLTIKK